MSTIDVSSGDPYRGQGGKFGTSPLQKLEDALKGAQDTKLVGHDDNDKKVKSFKKEAESKLAELRDGKTSGSGLMLEEQAREATKDSKYTKVVYHGTSSVAADSIAKGGFKLMDKATTGRQYGNGIYLTSSEEDGNSYADMIGKSSGKVISSMVDMKNPYSPKDASQFSNEALQYGKDQGIIKKSVKDIDEPPIAKWQQATAGYVDSLLKTHDGVILPDYFGNDMIVVNNPSQIKSFDVKDPSK